MWMGAEEQAPQGLACWISNIYQDLQIVVQELCAEIIPKDDQVKEWIEKYGSIDVIILGG